MRFLLSAMFAATVVLGTATDAMACRERIPRADDLAQRAFIAVTVTHAEPLGTPGWNTWRVIAEATPNGGGQEDRSTFEFTAGLSSDGCGQTPLPPTGERWVQYLKEGDSTKVLEDFPLDYVGTYDARLADVP
ncbi:MAG: hypothetical protein KF842_08730 [Caulobacter sp.]|nr:hypothetical protein [Caulobacter sp.]